MERKELEIQRLANKIEEIDKTNPKLGDCITGYFPLAEELYNAGYRMTRDACISKQHEKLTEICDMDFGYVDEMKAKYFARYLIRKNCVVLPNKLIPVMADENPFNSDVYCPYCGNNLSGLYGDEPTDIIQCCHCGKFLDNTQAMTTEEAKRLMRIMEA